MPMKVGRPFKFNSIEEMQTKVDDYFSYEEVPTITGLALALDTTRDVLIDYENRNDEFSNTIKKAKLKCQNFAEKHLFSGKNATGAIFNLKNNYNWKDKTEIDQNIKAEISLEPDPKIAKEFADFQKQQTLDGPK